MAQELDRLLGVREVLPIAGCKSRDTLYKRIAAGRFPPPLPNPDGRAPNKWRESALRAHQQKEFARLDEIAKKRQNERAAA